MSLAMQTKRGLIRFSLFVVWWGCGCFLPALFLCFFCDPYKRGHSFFILIWSKSYMVF